MNLMTAEQLQSEARYEEAIALLGPMSNMDHPRLNHHARAAKELIKRLTLDRHQGLSKAAAAYDQGQELMDKCDYDGAARALEAVPTPLRSSDHARLLAEAVDRRQEVAALAMEARAALGRKDISAAIPKITRLLELKPEHAAARQLAAQIQGRFVLAAEEKFAKHQYEEAAKLLSKAPAAVETPEAAAVRDRIEEAAWIAWDVRNAPVVDDVLLAVVERLRKASPSDPRGPRLLEEMRRRLAQAEKNGKLEPPPWVCAAAAHPAGLSRRLAGRLLANRSRRRRGPLPPGGASGMFLGGVRAGDSGRGAVARATRTSPGRAAQRNREGRRHFSPHRLGRLGNRHRLKLRQGGQIGVEEEAEGGRLGSRRQGRVQEAARSGGQRGRRAKHRRRSPDRPWSRNTP